MAVLDLDHFNLQIPAEQLELLLEFYRNVVGLQDGPRPLQSQGAWLYAGDKAVLHVSVRPIDFNPSASNGHFNHIAFACRDLPATVRHLDELGIEYQLRDKATQSQIFMVDPCGVAVELNFRKPPTP